MDHATLPDGARLAYDVFDFTPPWTKPETVVLVHGFSKNRRFWYGWIPTLAAHYRVITVDQRGHGDFSPIAREGFTMALRPFSEDLVAFVAALGLRSAHFVMAEFSSTVAMDFAPAFPNLLRSLTLPGLAYRYTDSPVDRSEWSRLAEEQGSEAWARATNANRLPADADPGMREWYIRQQGRAPSWFLADLFRFNQTLDLTDRLPHILCPTLIIAGGAARQGTIETVREAERLIPDCRLVVLDGLPYNVMSSAPERCAAETLRFLDTATGRTGGAARA